MAWSPGNRKRRLPKCVGVRVCCVRVGLFCVGPHGVGPGYAGSYEALRMGHLVASMIGVWDLAHHKAGVGKWAYAH